MENRHPSSAWVPTQPPVLKDSIRDMIRLQQDHYVPDELFWEIFNARVLLNEQIDVQAFFKTGYNG
jgi:uncharacterized protein YdhG (YjbR/CyaY superfamily)